jgi:DNA-binding response OmpR family regulator
MAKLLVIEDDVQIADTVVLLLSKEQHVVETAFNGSDGLALLRAFTYDLLILDWQLPDTTGLEVLKSCRQRGMNAPVLFLTAMKDIHYKEAGFELGADDYLTKPFDAVELKLRVKALLRRAAGQSTNQYLVGDISIDINTCEVSVAGKSVNLLPKEYLLLEYMSKRPHHLFSAEDLLGAIWASDTESSSNTVRTYVYTLRKKLAAAGSKCELTTVYGMGYRFEPAKVASGS